MDIVGVVLVIISTLTSLIAARTSYDTFRTFGTTFYRYLTIALCCFTLMPLGYIFPLLLPGPENQIIVLVGMISLNAWAYGGLACIVGGVEYLKDRPNTLIIDIAFLLAGLVVAGRFLPSYQEIIWNGESWEIIFKQPLMILFGLFYTFIAVSVLPFLLLLWYRIKTSGSFDFRTRALYLGTVVSVIYSAIVLVVNRGESVASSIFLHSQAYLIFSILGTIFFRSLLLASPTIFFATRDDLLYLGIVRTRDNEALVSYRFPRQDKEILSYLVTGVHSTLNTILQEAIQSTEDLNQIRIGRDVITVAKGRRITGFIISDREIEILNPLLNFTLELFERKYGHEVLARHSFPEFEHEVSDIFQFAIQSKITPRWLNIPKGLRKEA